MCIVAQIIVTENRNLGSNPPTPLCQVTPNGGDNKDE